MVRRAATERGGLAIAGGCCFSPQMALKRVTKKEAEAIFDALGAANPDPKTELAYHNPFTLLVAVVLSAQATDAGVNKATKKLFEQVDTPAAMLELGVDGLKQHIKTIGLYNSKAENVIGLSAALIERFGGKVPESEADLVSLPGVGRKTANVVRNEIFGHPTLAVDTHVFRVAHRIGLSEGKTPDAVERDLLKLVPKRWGRQAHHLLILHGRYLCKARAPECWRCPIIHLCRYDAKIISPPQGKRAGGIA